MVKHYTKGNLTVVWAPEKCAHSTHCWKELASVFNPRLHPWIDMEGADATRIMEQVSQCPSGALSYTINGSDEAKGE